MNQLPPLLIVEDEESILSVLKAAVERSGIRVVGVSSGAAAMELLECGEFSGVVSDLQIPGGIGGADLFDWIAQNRPQLTSRFLFITGNVHDAHALEVRQRTGAQFIEKPFRLALLIERIKAMVERGEVAHA
jgi:DNA-binding response OmpR family regulator